MSRVSPKLYQDVKACGEFNATACMNCGTCTGLCPIGLNILPRELFRYVVLGLEENVLEHTEAIFTCLLCKMCENNCPAEVDITGNVRTVRHYLNTFHHGIEDECHGATHQ